MDLIELCNEGIGYADRAYNQADIGTTEESIAYCFKILFTLFKEAQREDELIKIE